MKKNMFKVSPSVLTLVVGLIICCLVFSGCGKKDNAHRHTTADSTQNKKPPVKISPLIPHDVDPALQKKLKDEGNIQKLNRVFNKFSWEAFLAINWPTEKDGKPMPKLTDKGMPRWMHWKEDFEVYRHDGGKPAPWGSPRTAGEIKDGMAPVPAEAKSDKSIRIIYLDLAARHPGEINIADEEDQAFTGPLYDQNGNVVRYEILLNKDEFDYIIQTGIYNINGQVKLAKEKGPGFQLDFPKGDYHGKTVGAIEIKLAWKILEDSDHKDRYFKSDAYVLNNKTGKWEKKLLGLIGFHISQKTKTTKQWVWSTFEQVDNLREHILADGTRIKPSLTDPDCAICPQNQQIQITIDNVETTKYVKGDKPGQHGPHWQTDKTVNSIKNAKIYAQSDVPRTQARRMIEIPARVRMLNKKMRNYFAGIGSVWQYYELIDTQYPLDQDVPPANHTDAGNKLPEAVTNKPGGLPNIPYLTNISMETFFQIGDQSASNLIEGNPTNKIQIFGTESCMGCHSSAALNTTTLKRGTGGQLSADFSWLVQLKAQKDTTKKDK